jgi:hypothetical protein
MAISSLVNKVIYTGTDNNNVYNYGFKIFLNTELEVKVQEIATGVETDLVLTTDYTVSGVGSVSGGTITLVNASQAWLTAGDLSSDYKLVIKRKRALTQTTSIKNQNDYYPELHENQFDKLVMQDQDLQEQLDRSVKAAVSVDSADLDLEIPASYVGVNKAILMLNADGDAFENPPKTYDDLAAAASVGGFSNGSRVVVTNPSGIPEESATTSTELGYVSGVTSAIQTQLNGKQATITGAASTVVSSDLTASRALISNASGKITTTNVTHAELDRVSGVTSAIQTQLNAKAPSASPTFTGTVTLPATITGASAQVLTLPITSGTLSIYTAPSVQRFTSGSGTYTTPTGVKYIMVEMVGGGGGGAGSGTSSSGGVGGAGGNTTFGTSLLTANGGGGGTASGGQTTGGSVTINSPAVTLVNMAGASGGGSQITVTSLHLAGHIGGSSPFGGAGSGQGTGGGGAAKTNSGSGGASGGSGATALNIGSSGAAGGYIKALITNPDATYSYAIGAAGTAGTAGTNGYAGGAGGSGIIIVTEYYN